jgi:hypothetical protein
VDGAGARPVGGRARSSLGSLPALAAKNRLTAEQELPAAGLGAGVDVVKSVSGGIFSVETLN